MISEIDQELLIAVSGANHMLIDSLPRTPLDDVSIMRFVEDGKFLDIYQNGGYCNWIRRPAIDHSYPYDMVLTHEHREWLRLYANMRSL